MIQMTFSRITGNWHLSLTLDKQTGLRYGPGSLVSSKISIHISEKWWKQNFSYISHPALEFKKWDLKLNFKPWLKLNLSLKLCLTLKDIYFGKRYFSFLKKMELHWVPFFQILNVSMQGLKGLVFIPLFSVILETLLSY